MLIGIPAILSPELLFALRSMGHGDEIALVDGNFPAHAQARRLVRADGLDMLPLLEAVLRVLPLDSDVPNAIYRSAPGNDPQTTSPFHDQVDSLCLRIGKVAPLPLSAAELYPRIASSYSIVATTEASLFANVIIRKGVIVPVRERLSGY